LAVDYNELLKELSSHEITSVGCYTIGETIGEVKHKNLTIETSITKMTIGNIW
jgi:hypothetical protein